MLGPLIADMAAWTWENRHEAFYPLLIVEEAQVSPIGRAYVEALNAAFLDPERKVRGKEWAPASPRGTIEFVTEGLMWKVVAAWTGTGPFDVPQIPAEKDYYYASSFVYNLIRQLLSGATKGEAYHSDDIFVEMSKNEGFKHPYHEDMISIVLRAWDCFYRSFDFTSALHNAAKCESHRHAVTVLTGAFASAMYGSQRMFLKQKYSNELHFIRYLYDDIGKAAESVGLGVSVSDLLKRSDELRQFFPKNNALTNVEQHNYVPVKNDYGHLAFGADEKARLLKAFYTDWDRRYGLYLDDGWIYCYRSGCILGRFRLVEAADGWHVTDTQCSGEKTVEIFKIALYEVL